MSTQSERKPKLYSYIVTHDSGFAPNPFHEYCTLACCKPVIRRCAQEGDYVIGLAPKDPANQATKVVYVMQVSEKKTFQEYWECERFQVKKPNMPAGDKQAVGDNIYHIDNKDSWIQQESCHSEGYTKDPTKQMKTDLSGKNVLISAQKDFIYWGGDGPLLPNKLAGLVVGRGFRSKSNSRLLPEFKRWYQQQLQKQTGKVGEPRDKPPQPRRSVHC